MQPHFAILGPLRGTGYAVEENGQTYGVFIPDFSALDGRPPSSILLPGHTGIFIGSIYRGKQLFRFSTHVRIERIEDDCFVFVEEKR